MISPFTFRRVLAKLLPVTGAEPSTQFVPVSHIPSDAKITVSVTASAGFAAQANETAIDAARIEGRDFRYIIWGATWQEKGSGWNDLSRQRESFTTNHK